MTIGSLILPLFIIGLFAYVWFRVGQGWRTRIFNIVGSLGTIIATGAQLVLPALDGVSFSGVLPAVQAGIAAILIQVGNAILREVTTTPPAPIAPPASAYPDS